MLLQAEETGVTVDISLGYFPFEEDMIRHARHFSVLGTQIPVARPEDLVVMKAIAHRPRDISDIELILQLNPDLDRQLVLYNLSQFALALDMPELVTEMERTFKEISKA
jgi:hypothetical protein